jgi:hypothetical protein
MQNAVFSSKRSGAMAGALLLICLAAAAQQDTLPAQIGEWSASQSEQIAPAQAERVAGENAPALREYGLLRAEHRTYSRGATDKLEVTLFRLRDASAGYGAYSFLRTADMPAAQLAEHSSISGTRALILEKDLLLDVTGANLAASAGDLKTLGSAVSRRASSGSYPTLWQHMPPERMVPRSDRYVLGPLALHQLLPIADGDWLGFANGAEAELARYRLNGNEVTLVPGTVRMEKDGVRYRSNAQEVTLLLADYPTPQMAAKQLQLLAAQMNLNGTNASDARPPVYARRILTKIALVASARSRKEADSLLRQMDSGTELTWNEPGFSFSDPSVATMVVGAIEGSGLICLFAIIAGLAFGGVRLVIKKLLPGRVFDRNNSMEVLQLGLSSKPIEAKDFYSFH